jgi:hypothetical protein
MGSATLKLPVKEMATIHHLSAGHNRGALFS